MKTYYPIAVKLKKIVYCLWYINDIDGVLLDNQKVRSFEQLSQLNQYALANNLTIKIDEKIQMYDLDFIVEWIDHPNTPIDASVFLNGWNMMSDFAHSLQQSFLGDDREKTNSVYEKLFYGMNLPSINKTEKVYKPKWTQEEIALLKAIFTNGINIIKNGL